MRPDDVIAQLREIYARMIMSGLAVKQVLPSDRRHTNGIRTIGDLPSTAIALRDINYSDVYNEIDKNDAYHIKMPDGGLLLFQYQFNNEFELKKHRLAFFPSSVLPTMEEMPYLYENDELFADIMLNRLVRFPIRFDYDPENHQDVFHPKSHLTLGQFENCRIPTVGPLTPNAFLMFILRSFYNKSYIKFKNRFDKKMRHIEVVPTITESEKRVSHMVMV